MKVAAVLGMRPQTVEIGSNVLAGAEPKSILEKANLMIDKRRDWRNPFGDGKAAKRIVEAVKKDPAVDLSSL